MRSIQNNVIVINTIKVQVIFNNQHQKISQKNKVISINHIKWNSKVKPVRR